MELDSHAESPVVGSEALIIRTNDRKVRVNGFTPELVSKTVDVVDAEVAYECAFTGKVRIMVIRNGPHLKEMNHNLLSPFIMRLSGMELNEQPKFMTSNPTTKHHLVYFKENNIRLPLAIKGGNIISSRKAITIAPKHHCVQQEKSKPSKDPQTPNPKSKLTVQTL